MIVDIIKLLIGASLIIIALIQFPDISLLCLLLIYFAGIFVGRIGHKRK